MHDYSIGTRHEACILGVSEVFLLEDMQQQPLIENMKLII